MSQERTNEQINVQTSNKKSPIRIVIILLVLVVCIMGGVIVFLLLEKDFVGDESSNVDREVIHKEDVRNNVVTPDNVEEVISKLEEDEYIPVGYYEVSMTNEWIFADGTSTSSTAKVENPVTNRNMVYFTVAVDDNDVYSSPYLEPGSYIENIALDTVLPSGTYEAVLTYHLVDDAFREMSTLSVTVDIIIEN